MIVHLREVSGDDAGAEYDLARVRDVLARDETQEVALARSIRTDDPDTFAEPDLRLERVEDAENGETPDGQRPTCGPSAFESHADNSSSTMPTFLLGLLPERLRR